MGLGAEGTPTVVPPVLQRPPTQPDVAGNAARSAARVVLPGPGTPRKNPGAPRRDAGQRLKALEGQTSGKHWSVTCQYELVPEEQGSVATAQETEAAMREAREAGKLGPAGGPSEPLRASRGRTSGGEIQAKERARKARAKGRIGRRKGKEMARISEARRKARGTRRRRILMGWRRGRRLFSSAGRFTESSGGRYS